MLSVVCWKWTQPGGRAEFDAKHVNTFFSMVERNYSGEWEPVCVTDDPRGLDEHIRAVPLPDLFSGLSNPLGVEYASCYRRLAAFGPDLQRYFADRFVSVDLDCVIVDAMDPLWDREEDIVFWDSPIRRPDYNGSMWMAKKGVHPELLTEFDPNKTPIITKKAGHIGSDQGWFSYRLPGQAVWTAADDGVYAWNPQLRNRGYLLPDNARIVFFPGIDCPWHTGVQERAGWVREHYR